MMPIYLVRWPNLSISLIKADDEDELNLLLDEVMDPGCAQVEEYNGPLWVDFSVPLSISLRSEVPRGQPIAESDVKVDGVENLVTQLDETGFLLKENLPSTGETGCAMLQEISRSAFPHLTRVVDEVVDKDKKVDIDCLQRAIRLELRQLLQDSWAVAAVERKVDIEELRSVASFMDNVLSRVPPLDDEEEDKTDE